MSSRAATASWDQEFDLVVVGSGAGAMTAAIRAHDLGPRLVVGRAIYGGTRFVGRQIWIVQPLMQGPASIAREALTT
jgi:3-oxosteroid 1-dehydrogenase